MNKAGYDYLTLGNHDFNYGFDRLTKNLAQVDAQVSAVNILDKSGKILFPAVIHELENGLKIGIIGLVTDYVNVWEKKENIANLSIKSPLEAGKEAIAAIQSSIDYLVGIYHGGFEVDLETGEKQSDSTENIGYQLAKELSFDLLLTGHQHTKVEGRLVHGTYVVQPENMGKNFFEIDVSVFESGKVHTNSILRFPNGQYDQQLAESIRPLEQCVQKYLDQPVATIPSVNNTKDHLMAALKGNQLIEWIANVQQKETGADLSIVSLTNQMQELPTQVTIRDVLATYPFENTLFVIEITGKQLKNAMEHTAEYFAIENEAIIIAPHWLVPKVEHYNYDFYLGVEYTIDVAKPIGQRITRLNYHGKAIEEESTFTVALNNYRAFGGGDYTVYSKAKIIKDTQKDIQQLLIESLKESKSLTIDQSLLFEVCNSKT